MTDASKSEQELMEWVRNSIYHPCNGSAIVLAEEMFDLFTGMKLVPANAVVLTLEDAEQIERIATLPISTHARLVKAITEAQHTTDKSDAKVSGKEGKAGD